MSGPDDERLINQRELVEWLEDVASGLVPATAVQLLSSDGATRRGTLRSFYERVSRHPRYGGAWPDRLVGAGLAPTLSTVVAGPPPNTIWLALTGSPLPYLEMGQLVEQLEQLKRFVHLDEWVNLAAAGEFRAVLSHAAAQGPGDAAAQAFGFLDPHLTDRVTAIAAATRALDEVVTRTRLGRDGGALAVDGPRTRARALVAAGWLQRLASGRPLVLVVDDAHRAGSFVVDLVTTLLQSPAKVLVVLAGEPDGGHAERAPKLAGSFGRLVVDQVPPLSLAEDDAGRLAAALATVGTGGVFLDQHARSWSRSLGIDDHGASIANLVVTGWVRPLAEGVFGFSSPAHHRAALDQAAELVPGLTDERIEAVARAVASTTTEDDELRHVAAYDAWARQPAAPAEARWALARILAVRGQLAPAARLAADVATSADRRAVVALWQAVGWPAPHEPAPHEVAPHEVDSAASTAGPAGAPLDAAGATALAVASSSPATRPEDVRKLLAPVLDAPAVDLSLRLACARVLLGVGDLDGAARAIGPDATEWLPAAALDQLDALTVWRDTPGLVARSVDVLVNLHAIAAARRAVPGSLALGHLLVARLELLERYGRLETADDTLAIADEAVQVFTAARQSPPIDAWLARRWQAWTRARRGDPSGAQDLARIVDEQRRLLGAGDPTLLETVLWHARSLLLAGDAASAHELLHGVRAAQRRMLIDEHPDLLRTCQWHASSKADGGDPAAAVDELSEVVRMREAVLGVDDEDLLTSRHQLGSALAAAGRWQEAADVLGHVLERRSQLDLPDAPRVLAARFSRALCLTFLHRSGEAQAELDAVIALAEATTDPATIAVKARNTRGVGRLMGGSWSDALADLDVVVQYYAAHRHPDDEVALCARQQRAECLRWLGRHAEARHELDGVLQAAASLPADHPLLATVHQQQADLAVG